MQKAYLNFTSICNRTFSADSVASALCQVSNYKTFAGYLWTLDDQEAVATSMANLFLTIENLNIDKLKRSLIERIFLEKNSKENLQAYVPLVEDSNTTADIRFILPPTATIIDHTISAQLGNSISFQAGINARSLRDCLSKSNLNVSYTLWYYDSFQSGKQSLPLNFNPATYSLSFVMPSSQIRVDEITYAGGSVVAGSCGISSNWVGIDGTTPIVDFSNGLIAHYKFEGNTNDSSEKGYHISEYGGVSYRQGILGQSGSFDGVDDYIELDFNTLQTMSLFVWIKAVDGTIYAEDGGYRFNVRDNILKASNKAGSECSGQWGPKLEYTLDANNSWYHIGFVRDEIGNFTIFVDANEQSSNTNSGLIPENCFSKTIGVNYYGLGDTYQKYLKGDIDDLRIYNRALNEAEISTLYQQGSHIAPAKTNVNLLHETYLKDTVVTTAFTKEWTFSEDISTFTVNVVGNSYLNTLTTANFIKTGNTLQVNLTPASNSTINKLTLQFTNSNGQVVSVSGSQTFWVSTNTNNPPRLADGQITQLVSSTGAISTLDINTYDADGDAVLLSIINNAGGNVVFNGNTLTASFSDAKVAHTILIGLDDGKELVSKEINVLQFDTTTIDTFYSDVDKNAGGYIYDGIAFGTLKGVVWGQPDPLDPTKRIFRPTDPASLAEALAIILKSAQKAGHITLPSQNLYRQAYPSWVMPYYTFARDKGIIDQEIFNLSSVYPTREVIAKFIVKILELDKKAYAVDTNFTFVDEVGFTDDTMRYYGKIAHAFGLFMTESFAMPTDTISRAELTLVIEKIFMIPSATIAVNPSSVEYGDLFSASLTNIEAENIDPLDYSLYNATTELQITYLANGMPIANPIDSTIIDYRLRTLEAVIDNNGVKNVITTGLTITFSDQDGDGVQDRNDAWITDIRYAFDSNNNGIPDILDSIYSLSLNSSTDIVNFNGQLIVVADIIRDGGFTPDLDGDGISDALDPDIDGDGYLNVEDVFPRDNSEWQDTDGDGIGNNADQNDNDGPLADYDNDGILNQNDPDDDNDGLTDTQELANGLNPLDASDGANVDSDSDGVTNLEEILAGTNPKDATDYPIPNNVKNDFNDDQNSRPLLDKPTRP